MGEPASFWRENVIVIVILLRVFVETSQSNVKGFVILRPFKKDNSGNPSGEKKYNEAFRCLVLVVVLVLLRIERSQVLRDWVQLALAKNVTDTRTQISFGLYENKQEV